MVSRREPRVQRKSDATPNNPVLTESGATTAPDRRGWLTRRRLLGLVAGGVAAAGGGLAYSRWMEPYFPVVERLVMRLPRLHDDLAGRRVVHLSDLHIGAGISTGFFAEQMKRVQALRPDLVLFSGDFHTNPLPHEREDIMSVLRELHPPLGAYACLGNHDYAAYHADPHAIRDRSRTIAAWAEHMLASVGVRVLRNASHVLECGRARLQLVGLEDMWSGLYDCEAAFARVDPALPTVVLSHNPDTIADLHRMPCDLVLCGHTHGGQVRLPGVGALILPVRLRQYDMGRFAVGDKQLYVNRGLGTLRRIRFNCPPEIAEFTLST